MAVVDELYLENLDELVNDENKVVTFKWLSTNLKVHVNQAKQMLYAFVQQERNKKDNDKLNVTYFLAGIPKNKNGCLGHKCMVVPEEDVEAFKTSSFSTVTSCHIYSVQKVKLKDSGTLYIADYDNTKEKIMKCNKYSAINYARAKARSKEEQAKLGVRPLTSETSKPNESQSSVSRPAANGTSSTKMKTEPKGSIASMFSAGGKKKDTNDNSVDVKSKVLETEKPKQTKAGKSGGMMSFFSKQTEKASKPVETKKLEAVKEEPKLPSLNEKKTETKKVQSVKGKKSTRVSDSDDENKPDKKRRKRIRDDLFESSSSEDDMEVLEESPVPSPVPSPVRDPSPEPESPLLKKISQHDSDDDTGEATQTNGSQKRRKRTRKLVPKTFMDEDGFMVTEKVWESDSTDVSEKEDEPKKVQTPEKQSRTSSKKTISPQKKSPPKGAGAKNQMSLTSFFKKK